MEEVADARGAIDRAENFLRTNWNYIPDNGDKAVALAHLAAAHAMTELVAVSQPQPDPPKGGWLR